MAKIFRQLCSLGFAVATPLAGQKQDLGLHQQVRELNLNIGATTQGTLLAKSAKLEKLASGYETVEGPLYDGKGHLLFTDIPNQQIWKLNLKTLNTTLFLDDTGGANGLAFDFH